MGCYGRLRDGRGEGAVNLVIEPDLGQEIAGSMLVSWIAIIIESTSFHFLYVQFHLSMI